MFGLELPFYMLLAGKICGQLHNSMAQAKHSPIYYDHKNKK